MELYIVRHGLAGEHGSYTNDEERPLTKEGQEKTRKVAQRLQDLEIRVDLILTSPLVRARQTADLLKAAKVGDRLEESTYLAPNGSFQSWLEWLGQWQQGGGASLAIVGHEPGLSEWAERLIWGEPKGRLLLKKAGVIGLMLPVAQSPVGASTLFWLTPPRFLL